MSAPDRIAMCVADGGENLHVRLEPGEPCPTSCFEMGCDCTPVEYVRVALPAPSAGPPMSAAPSWLAPILPKSSLPEEGDHA